MSYIGNTPGVSSQRVVLEEVITGSPKSVFTPVSGYTLGYVDVLVNGVEVDTADFTASDGVNVTLATAAAVGETVKIKTWLPRGLSDGYLKSEADALLDAKLDTADATTLLDAKAPTASPSFTGNVTLSSNGVRIIGSTSNRGNLQMSAPYIATAQGFDRPVSYGNNVFINSAGNWEYTNTSIGGSAIVMNSPNGTNGQIAFFAAQDPDVASTVTECGRFTTAGLVLPAGKGIDFSANSNAGGMTGELLDDYETGTWTPTLGLDGTGHSYTYFTRKYVKIGKQVTVFFAFSVTNVASQSAGGLYINGLPFTAEGSANTYENGVSALMTERMGGTYSAASPHTWFVGGVSGNTQLCVFEQNYNGSIANSTYFTSGSKSSVQIGSTNVYFVGQHTYTAA